MGNTTKTNENSRKVIKCLIVHWLGGHKTFLGNLREALFSLKKLRAYRMGAFSLAESLLHILVHSSPLYTSAFNLRTCTFYKTTMHRWKLDAFNVEPNLS